MGPRPDGRGTLVARCSALCRILRFNGAATGWPRNALDEAGLLCGVAASMGPRPDGRGTGGRRRLLNVALSLQWGRDRMAAERRRRQALPAHGWGFNGAATGWPRNGIGGNSSPLALNELQWGRDRMAAERALATSAPPPPFSASMGPRPDGRGTCARSGGRRDAGTRFNGAATGWPRNGGLLGLGHLGVVASMGPRPDGRGTPEPARRLQREDTLQWGRDRMAAER